MQARGNGQSRRPHVERVLQLGAGPGDGAGSAPDAAGPARSRGSDLEGEGREGPHPEAGNKAADGSRTRDLELGKLTLYQLSYRRTGQILRGSRLPLVAMGRRVLPMLAWLVGACLVALLIYGVSAQSASRTLDEQVARGHRPLAPEATRSLPVLGGGGKASLASFRGKVVVLNFWASWCEPCQVEAPLLERAQGRLELYDGTVLGVTYLDASPDSQSFVRRYHLTYPNLRDTAGTFTHAYGTDQLPESFVIDRDGHIVAISRGEIDQAFLNHAIALAQSS
jgi:cytochrome c biogenesis protein CcmG, thiol:disulfide interchange protein DsbE